MIKYLLKIAAFLLLACFAFVALTIVPSAVLALNKDCKQIEIKESSSYCNCDSNPHPKIYNDNDGMNLTMIPIVTMQRSSSSYLSNFVLGEMPCHVSLFEIFMNTTHHAGDAWAKEGKTFLRPREDQAAEFVVAVAKRRCHEMFAANATLATHCQSHCFANFKIHDFHLGTKQHLYNQNKSHLQPFNDHDNRWDSKLLDDLKLFNEKAMILERRETKDQWKSLRFAENTGDWSHGAGSHNKQDHKQKLKAAKIEPLGDLFQRRHDAWYSYGRRTLLRGDIPLLELTYDDVTGTSIEVLRKNISIFLGHG